MNDKIIRTLLSTFLAVTLLVNSSVAFAQVQTQAGTSSNGTGSESGVLGTIADTANSFNNGDLGVNKKLARPISYYLLKRMGTTGFLLSKYMNYRKQLTQPRCTLSQNLAYASYMLMLIGDIADHVILYKNARDLKKEYSDKMGVIDQQLGSNKELNNNINQQALPTQNSDPNPLGDQFLAIDYLIAKTEKDLKRQKVITYFKYPALAMQLTANLINITEMFAETTSFGAYIAEVNACITSQKPKTTADELKIQAESEAKGSADNFRKLKKEYYDEAPWYLKPFSWLALKLDKPNRAIKEYRGGLDGSAASKLEYAQEAKAQGGDMVSAVDPHQSAAYAEEMIVGIITQMKKKSTDLQDIAIRLTVRKLIKSNIVAVDGLMRSATGRFVVYAYNLWVMYSDFENTKKNIEITKERIAFLKSYRDKIRSLTKTTSSFFYRPHKYYSDVNAEKVMSWVQNVLLGQAFANNNDLLEDVANLKLCISDTSCKEKFDLLKDANVQKTFNSLPLQLQKSQLDNVRNSYSVVNFVKFSRGDVGIQVFDVDRVEKEIKEKENEVNKKFEELQKIKHVNLKEVLKHEQMLVEKDLQTYGQFLRPDFNQESNSVLEKSQFQMPELANSSKNKEQPLSVPAFVGPEVKIVSSEVLAVQDAQNTSATKPEIENEKYEFNSDIHIKEDNIFEIIHYRYLKRYGSFE